MLNSKNEKGNLTMFVVALMLFLLSFAGVFINVIMNYTNTNVTKKAMAEAVRTRALTIDVYMKERYGIIETVYPVETDLNEDKNLLEKERTDLINLRDLPVRDPLTNKVIPTRTSIEYKSSVKYANSNAKRVMIDSLNAYGGNRIVGDEEDSKMIDMYEKNICFDVKPIPKEDAEIEFSCTVEDNKGERFLIKAKLKVSGYENLKEKNKEKIKNMNLEDENMYVVNVVFGGAVITPKIYMPSAISKFTFLGEQNQFIYSVAYPQIDTCYRENEC